MPLLLGAILFFSAGYSALSPIRQLSARVIASDAALKVQNGLRETFEGPQNAGARNSFFSLVNNVVGIGLNEIETLGGHPAVKGSYFNP